VEASARFSRPAWHADRNIRPVRSASPRCEKLDRSPASVKGPVPPVVEPLGTNLNRCENKAENSCSPEKSLLIWLVTGSLCLQKASIAISRCGTSNTLPSKNTRANPSHSMEAQRGRPRHEGRIGTGKHQLLKISRLCRNRSRPPQAAMENVLQRACDLVMRIQIAYAARRSRGRQPAWQRTAARQLTFLRTHCWSRATLDKIRSAAAAPSARTSGDGFRIAAGRRRTERRLPFLFFGSSRRICRASSFTSPRRGRGDECNHTITLSPSCPDRLDVVKILFQMCLPDSGPIKPLP